MSYECLEFEASEHIATVTLNRPDKLNALNVRLRDELESRLPRDLTDDEIRAVPSTGTGKGFSFRRRCHRGYGAAGQGPSQNARLDDMGWVGRLAMNVYEIGKPTIAVMNGVAAGAGIESRARLRHAQWAVPIPGSRPSSPSAACHRIPACPTSCRASWVIQAADLIFTSRNVSGEEAYRLGLLDRLVEASEIMDCARGVAAEMAALPPMAIRSGKRVLQYNMDLDFHRALRNETMGRQFARRSPNDQKEQRAAFAEKRKPNFTGT
ncbi:MAG: enoyl-CoA hydratase/isomerase family protein [Gammaproteobacteria bacterium]|nr:enoyl-CoA hydratase/isomerase family protein [Gammaproteobacteria bacterium]